MSEPGERIPDASTHPSPNAVARWSGAATIHHDGKWLVLYLDSDELLDDVETLLTLKRRAKPEG